jgi:2-C-methyl-D-erythritol 4-phosphate cytidylyltransferase/2-C-methyl-D-erythritol 2,4-cyclodiphosphate synthase
MNATSDTALLVVAAGRGSRAGAGLPKQYRAIAGRPVLGWTLEALLGHCPDSALVCVIHPDDIDLFAAACVGLEPAAAARLLPPAFGGATRQASVHAGLEALAARAPALVLIHDGARPFATPALVARARQAARTRGAAIPGVPVVDTVKEVDADGRIVATPPRARLRAVQTPQAFQFPLILAAHRAAAAAAETELTDDAAVAEWAGHAVHVFEGDSSNMKITSAEDLAAAEARLIGERPDIRIGQGYDVHAFGPGDGVWLGGLLIPHKQGLIGHSDADVLSHAITDALFGALGDGDIGSHFPPSDPQWRGAASAIFLAAAAEAVRAKGGMIAHVDATIVCETPKIGPHREAIRAKLASIMGVSMTRVALKATTSERLGFTGREEGMAALALATVRLPL